MNQKPKTNPTLLKHAREMRRQPTEPERRLWQQLRHISSLYSPRYRK